MQWFLWLPGNYLKLVCLKKKSNFFVYKICQKPWMPDLYFGLVPMLHGWMSTHVPYLSCPLGASQSAPEGRESLRSREAWELRIWRWRGKLPKFILVCKQKHLLLALEHRCYPLINVVLHHLLAKVEQFPCPAAHGTHCSPHFLWRSLHLCCLLGFDGCPSIMSDTMAS